MDYDIEENLDLEQEQDNENADNKAIVRTKLPRGYMIARLMKGVVYKEDDPTLFNNIIQEQNAIKSYVRELGLNIVIHEKENYIFLRSLSEEEYEKLGLDDDIRPPTLIAKRKLSFEVSLLLVMLRKLLLEHDRVSSNERLVLSFDDILAVMASCFGKTVENASLRKKTETCISKICEMSFLKKINHNQEVLYEVKRILISIVNANFIDDFNKLVEQYLQIAKKEQ